MNKILINFAHPAKSHSTINNALRTAVQGLEGITVNDLYSNYPDFMIDVKREQTLCEEHDIIVFQHPFYWYSTPAIMKEWLDLVLEHGWAYGSKGKALQDKMFLQAITAGGDAATYKKDGLNEFTIAELLSPFQATIKLCNMIWLPPFAVTGVHRGLADEKVKYHANNYSNTLIALRDSKINIEEAQNKEFLNSNSESLKES